VRGASKFVKHAHTTGYGVYARLALSRGGRRPPLPHLAPRLPRWSDCRLAEDLDAKLRLATLGLGFLKKRGKAKTGAALLATAAGLALLKRK
jgi:hypothetical protein